MQKCGHLDSVGLQRSFYFNTFLATNPVFAKRVKKSSKPQERRLLISWSIRTVKSTRISWIVWLLSLFFHFIRSHACCVHGTESPLHHSLSQSGRSLRQFSLRKLCQHRSSLRIPNSPCLAQVHRSRHVLRRDAGIHLRAHSLLLFALLHRIRFILDPSKIGTLCEELVSDYDDQIIGVLQKFADGSKENVEKSLCVDIAHACSKKEYKRVGELEGLRAQIQNYSYRHAMTDFQEQQDIKTMDMNEEL